jgi:arabinofuranan 3-O-arabinosyltransferase
VWPVAILSFIYRVISASQQPAQDLMPIWLAGRLLLHHQPPYQALHFVDPPSMLLLAAPLALVPFAVAKEIFLFADAAGILLATALLLRLFDVGLNSLVAAVTLLALGLFSSVQQVMPLDNPDGLVLLAEACFITLAARSAWVRAGVALGLSFAVKPILPVLLVIPLVRGRWASMAAVVAVPGLLSGMMLGASAHGQDFFTNTVPLLLRGNGPEFAGYNVSLAGGAALAGYGGGAAVTAVRAAVAAAALYAAWLAYTRGADLRLRTVEASGLLLAGTFASFSFSWAHYPLLLLPLFISAVHPDSILRSLGGGLALYLTGSPDVWATARGGRVILALGDIRTSIGYVVLILVALYMLRRRPEAPARWETNEP